MYTLKHIIPNINTKNTPYFVGLTSFMLSCLLGETYWEFLQRIRIILLYFSAATLLINFSMSIRYYCRTSEVISLFVSFIIFTIVGINIQQFLNVFISFLLIFGAKGIVFDDIVKTYFIVGASFWITTVIGSQIGLVRNVADDLGIRDVVFQDVKNRWCLGYRWPTNMANHFFFVLAAYFYIVRGKLKTIEVLIILLISFYLLYKSDVRLSVGCVLLLLFSVFYVKLVKGYVNRKIIPKVVFIFIPLCFVITYIVSVCYDETSVSWLMANLFVSNRLALSHNALVQYGISFLGQFFIMYGSVREDGIYYNFIDSSYLQLLVIYGLCYSVLIAIGYYIICKRAFLRNDMVLIISVCLTGLAGIFCQHFLQFYMNPFFLALFALHRNNHNMLL